jgi:hypothetical protein
MPGIIVGVDGSDHSRHARCPVVVIPAENI